MNPAVDSLVFFDIDTQVDFMEPSGKLYVPGAEEIVPNLKRLMDWARTNEVPVISSADAHTPNDEEFKMWPPHCLAGTPGQHRIAETQFPDPVIIPCRSDAFNAPAHWKGQFVVEKRTYSVQDNPNFDAVLKALGPRFAVVFGVVTEYCVRAAVLALCRQGFAVDLVADAIKCVKAEDGAQALAEMKAAGAKVVETADVCK